MKTKIYRQALSASTLKGDEVYNPQGEKIGKVDDIMLDVENGGVAYVVLSFGGFVGLGDKLFAIPWGAMRVDETPKRFILNIEKEKLKNAEGFDKNHWPDYSSEWRDRLYDYYDIEPYWKS